VELTTIPFAYFVLVVLTVTWAVRGHRGVRNAWLLVASYAFAGWAHPALAGVLAGSTLVHHAIARRLARAGPRARRAWLFAGVSLALGVLGYFKYWNFFTGAIGEVAAGLGLEAHLPLLQAAAPLGLSFYTFQGIAYLVDTYRGTAVPAGLLDFALFQAFFAKFAAGPIVRSSQLVPQLQAKAARTPDVARAATLIFAGLCKKLVLGTYLATHMVEDAFRAPQSATCVELWIAVFAYTAQIYLDFSGYTDLARGVAELLGFDLPENFRYPYAATSLGDYWRRWHMTFSAWLRDYVYFPLGGSRGGPWRTYLNLVVTFALCGLWHGPTWGFVLWGTTHGVMLAIAKRRRDRRRGGEPSTGWAGQAAGWATTLAAVALARVWFKADHLDQAFAMFAGLAGRGASPSGLGIEPGVVAVTALTFAMNLAGRRAFDAAVAWHRRLPAVVWPVAWTAVALALLTVRPYDVAFTIYFSF
jgi:alginate O-acetyltransferase complex protein AlgI